MRLFVALVPPPEVVAALPPVPAGVRAVPPAQVHLTLAFLGEQPDVQPFATAVSSVASLPAPRLRLAGAGAFGTAVWLGFAGDLDHLAVLAEAVQNAVRARGVELERRSWRPHLTVGRALHVVPRSSPLLDELGAYEGPSASWTAVRLIRSHLGRGGAQHESVAAWTLPSTPVPS